MFSILLGFVTAFMTVMMVLIDEYEQHDLNREVLPTLVVMTTVILTVMLFPISMKTMEKAIPKKENLLNRADKKDENT